jgi:erythromycin esterase-like protein
MFLHLISDPAAKAGSWEDLLHKQNPADMLLLSKQLQQLPLLRGAIGHRAIGVKYNPGQEMGNYVPGIIPKRYDAFIYMDETKALLPLGTPARKEPPDTYPSGF